MTANRLVANHTIKRVPADPDTRQRLRELAAELARGLPRTSPPSLESLRHLAAEALQRLSLPQDYLGYAMVAADSAFWAPEFHTVPFERRLLLLPHCLADETICQGTRESVGLRCALCGACDIGGLKRDAERLGYQVIVAEGTSAVVSRVLDGEADAILGVACLDSLEKSFDRIADLGIPHQAIPLLTDGCRSTTAELDLIRTVLYSSGDGVRGTARTYLPLLRHVRALFSPQALAEALADCACPVAAPDDRSPLGLTDTLARDWLLRGGKRLRPFITLAAYAVGRHGEAALRPDSDLSALIPDAVRRLGLAIEAFHKASLVHDDIEDADAERYGQPTLHRAHGLATAINVGDYLIGLGYRVIAAQAEALGPECVADILRRLSAAHLRLCCGQGAELVWDYTHSEPLRPLHALRIGALKTAPAFEAALYAGLRAAGAPFDEAALREFATLVGEGFQVLDDLSDWDADSGAARGRDAIAGRPTVLRAFAVEAGAARELDAARDTHPPMHDPQGFARRIHEVYCACGALARAEVLYTRLRERALESAARMGAPPLSDLMSFLVRSILHRRDWGPPDRAGGFPA